MRMIVVIGAGICGLAAAYELSRRGHDVVVLERGRPFGSNPPGWRGYSGSRIGARRSAGWR